MAGFDDLAFPADEAPLAADKPPAYAALGRTAGEPLFWLAGLAVTLPLYDGVAGAVCGASCGTAGLGLRFLLVLAVLVGAGFALKEAFARYLEQRTMIAAGALAAVPVAYLLAFAAVPAPPPEPDLAPLEAQLAESEEARRALATQVELLRAEVALIEVPPSGPSVAEIQEIAEAAAASLLEEAGPLEPTEAAEEVAAPVEAAPREPSPEEIAAAAARLVALQAVGPRIAGAGPVDRNVAEPAPALSEELQFVVTRLELNAAEQDALARNAERQTCIVTRLAERGPFQAFRHRTNREAFAEYLAPCFE